MKELSLKDEGRRLEELSISLIREKNWTALEELIDPACQFVTARGSLNRDEAMALMKTMELADVSLERFKVTRSGDTLVISFWLGARESVDGKPVPSEPSPRLSIWSRSDSGWNCIAYADFGLDV